MTDRKKCKRIIENGSCMDLEELECEECPLDAICQGSEFSRALAKEWLEFHPKKAKKDWSAITTEQLKEAIRFYENKENEFLNVVEDKCKGISCNTCPYYNPSEDLPCDTSEKKVQKAIKKELKQRNLKELLKTTEEDLDRHMRQDPPLLSQLLFESIPDWSNFSTEQLIEAVDCYNDKEFGVGTHPCKGLYCQYCPYFNPEIIKCDKDYKEVHKAHEEELTKRLGTINIDYKYVEDTTSLTDILSMWWEIVEGVYAKVDLYSINPSNIFDGEQLFRFEGIVDDYAKKNATDRGIFSFVNREWFSNHNGYVIPPEV